MNGRAMSTSAYEMSCSLEALEASRELRGGDVGIPRDEDAQPCHAGCVVGIDARSGGEAPSRPRTSAVLTWISTRMRSVRSQER